MKMSLLVGVALTLFMLTIAQSVNDYRWLVLICGGAGVLSFALAGALAGIPSKKEESGKETGISRQSRIMQALNVVFFGLPNIVAAATGLFFI